MAVVLNGTSQLVNIGSDVPELDLATPPISLYAEFRTTSETGTRYVFHAGSGSSFGSIQYAHAISNTGAVMSRWGHGSTSTAMVTSPSGKNDGEWHRVLLTLAASGSDSVLRQHIDGSQTGSTTAASQSSTPGGRAAVGAITNSNDTFSLFWDGELRSVGVWARAFTLTQSQDLTSGAVSPTFFTTNRRALWLLDHDAGDSGPNNLHGTPVGSPQWTHVHAAFDAAADLSGTIADTDFGDPVRLAGGRQMIPRLIAAANLIANPSLDDDTSGWFAFGGTLTRSTEQFASPPASARFVPNGTTGTASIGTTASAAPPAQPGQEFRARGWVMFPDGYADVGMAISWLDGSDNILSDTIGATISAPAGVWSRVEVVGTAPTGTAKASPRFRVPGTPATSDVAFLDDMTIRRLVDGAATRPVRIHLAGG